MTMSRTTRVFALLCAAAACALALFLFHAGRHPATVAAAAVTPSAYTPTYTKGGDLIPPVAQYREWIYLTSGLDMNYNPSPSVNMSQSASQSASMFDNVFVNPEAYHSFVVTGTWPDKTVFVLESRVAGSKGSINKAGHFQSGGVTGLEIHIKDESRFPGKWAFFDVASESKATLFPQTAACYSCHTQHAGVDTTFVQFYPTLLPLAEKKGTLSDSYRKESAAQNKQ